MRCGGCSGVPRPDERGVDSEAIPRRLPRGGRRAAAHRQRGAIAALTPARRGEPNARAVRELYRALHTIKGLSGMVGVEPIVELAHALETVLRVADRGAGKLSPEAVELCLQGVKAIEERVFAVARSKEAPPSPARLLAALLALEPVPAQTPAPAGPAAIRPELDAKLSPADRQQIADGLLSGRRLFLIEFVPSAERAEAGINITTVRERVGRVAEIVKVVPRSVKLSAAAPGGLAFDLLVLCDGDRAQLAEAAATTVDGLVQVGPEPAPPPTAAGPLDAAAAPPDAAGLPEDDADPANEDDSRRTGAGHVRAGRAVPARRRPDPARRADRGPLPLATGACRPFGGGGGRARPARARCAAGPSDRRSARRHHARAHGAGGASCSSRIPLLVRGLGRSTGKQVRVSIDAGDAELDKAVAERLFPAIVHLVRNAVDHAIEPPDGARRASASSPRGSSSVTCRERSNNRLELVVARRRARHRSRRRRRRAGRRCRRPTTRSWRC